MKTYGDYRNEGLSHNGALGSLLSDGVKETGVKTPEIDKFCKAAFGPKRTIWQRVKRFFK